MKYQNKTFSMIYGSKSYRDNFDESFGKDVEFVNNGDGTVSFDMDVPDDLYEVVVEESKKRNLPIEETLSKMIQEGFELIMKKEENE